MARSDEGKTRRAGETIEARETYFSAAGMASFEPLVQAGNCLLDGWMAVGNELLEFSKLRLDRGLAMSRAITQSSSFNEAIDLQARYTRTTMQEYFTEANKLADLGARSVIDSLARLQSSTEEGARSAGAAE